MLHCCGCTFPANKLHFPFPVILPSQTQELCSLLSTYGFFFLPCDTRPSTGPFHHHPFWLIPPCCPISLHNLISFLPSSFSYFWSFYYASEKSVKQHRLYPVCLPSVLGCYGDLNASVSGSTSLSEGSPFLRLPKLLSSSEATSTPPAHPQPPDSTSAQGHQPQHGHSRAELQLPMVLPHDAHVPTWPWPIPVLFLSQGRCPVSVPPVPCSWWGRGTGQVAKRGLSEVLQRSGIGIMRAFFEWHCRSPCSLCCQHLATQLLHNIPFWLCFQLFPIPHDPLHLSSWCWLRSKPFLLHWKCQGRAGVCRNAKVMRGSLQYCSHQRQK